MQVESAPLGSADIVSSLVGWADLLAVCMYACNTSPPSLSTAPLCTMPRGLIALSVRCPNKLKGRLSAQTGLLPLLSRCSLSTAAQRSASHGKRDRAYPCDRFCFLIALCLCHNRSRARKLSADDTRTTLRDPSTKERRPSRGRPGGGGGGEVSAPMSNKLRENPHFTRGASRFFSYFTRGA